MEPRTIIPTRSLWEQGAEIVEAEHQRTLRNLEALARLRDDIDANRPGDDG